MGTFTVSTLMETVNVPIIDLARRAQALRIRRPFRVRSDEHVLFASRSEPERAASTHCACQGAQRSTSRRPFVDALRLANSCDAYMPTNIPTSTATKNCPITASMTASMRAVDETGSTSP